MSAVAVIGLGKLGAVLAGVLANRGHTVIGVDVNQNVVDQVDVGHAPVVETGLQVLYDQAAYNLTATTDFRQAVARSTIAFIIVPTPTDHTDGFTSRYVIEAVTEIGQALQTETKRYTVVVCSTVMPGETNGAIRSALEVASGREIGPSLGLCYSPEFIALGSVIHDMTHPDMVLMGAADDASMLDLYDVIAGVPQSDPVYFRLSLIDAEIAKISLNTYITMKISFANLLGEICQEIDGADASWVTAAIGADSRVGSRYITPGGAYGGPCFPRDTKAFAVMARNVGVSPDLADASDAINQRQAEQLADELGKCDAVTVLGLSYKPHTNVTENSFGVDLTNLLQFQGVVVTTYDPVVAGTINGNNNTPTVDEALRASDVVVIATPWDEFRDLDYTGKRVIDMWGIVPEKWEPRRFGRA